MKKYFIVTNEKFLKRVEKDREIKKSRDGLIKKFYEENAISGNAYHFGGSGLINVPFNEENKEDICLYIPDNDENYEKYGKQFTKTRADGLVKLRKNSKLLKNFQSACIEDGVVINFYSVRPGDYFEELTLGGYSSSRFMFDEKMYLRIDTDNYNDKSITPKCDGFDEIKASEFYSALEECTS